MNMSSQFKTLLGPLFLACALFAIALKPTSTPWSISAVALVGLLLSHQWRWVGVLASTILLFIIAFIVPSTDPLWMTFLICSIAASFAITVLAQDDSESVQNPTPSQTNQSDAVFAYEAQMIGYHKMISDQEKLQTQIQSKTTENVQLREQLKQQQESHAQVQVDCIAAYEVKLEEHRKVIDDQGQRERSLQSQLEDLQSQVDAKAIESSSLKDQLQERQKALDSQGQREHVLQSQVAELHAKVVEHALLKEQLRGKLDEQIAALADLQTEFDALKTEAEKRSSSPGEVGSQELSRVSGLYQQLREQFAEKSNTLAEVRQQLFRTQEQLSALQRQHEDELLAKDLENQAYIAHLLESADEEMALLEQKDQEIAQLHAVIDAFTR